ncbi:MAG: nitroreductase family protein [Bacillota bacterium]|nr:nitroreductase family protein [Bacillota bacterium]
MSNESIIDVMYERHSVRKYTDQKITNKVMEKIIQAAGSAPSAWNLQPWKFILVQDQGLKEKLCEAAYGQQQVKEAAVSVIVLGDTQANLNAEGIYSVAANAGYMPESVKNDILANIKRVYDTVPNAGVQLALQNSSYAAMQLMLAAKAEGIDSCPMTGYDSKAIRELLEIPDRYIPTLLVTLGYASQPAHGSGRFPVNQILFYDKFGSR